MARDRAACVARQAVVSRHGAGRSRRSRGRTGRAGHAGQGAAGARQETGRAGSRRAGGRREGVRHGAHGLGAGRAAWASGLATGCALGALGLFSIRLDSVLFLSQFLGIVREPGS